MIVWIALMVGSLGVGLGLVALWGEAFRRALVAETWRHELDQAFADGYQARRNEERKRTNLLEKR